MITVAVVGEKNTGKTLLIERLVEDLSRSGCRVAVAKHIHHDDFDVDVEGKDTWRAYAAGAEAVAGASPRKLFIVARKDEDLSLIAELLRTISKPDLLLLEGFSGMLNDDVYVVATGSRRMAAGNLIGKYDVGSEDSYKRILEEVMRLCRSLDGSRNFGRRPKAEPKTL